MWMTDASMAERWIARALLALFAVGLALIVLLPSDGHEVLGLVERVARVVAALGVPYGIAFRVLEFGANIVLFVPLGVLLPLVCGSCRPRVLWATVLLGALFSTAIELVQLVIPGRVTSGFDVLANTLGTSFGVLLLLLWRSTRRPANPHPDDRRAEPVQRGVHPTRI